MKLREEIVILAKKYGYDNSYFPDDILSLIEKEKMSEEEMFDIIDSLPSINFLKGYVVKETLSIKNLINEIICALAGKVEKPKEQKIEELPKMAERFEIRLSNERPESIRMWNKINELVKEVNEIRRLEKGVKDEEENSKNNRKN